MIRQAASGRKPSGLWITIASAGLLAGCTTTSFAPPLVNTEHPATRTSKWTCKAAADERQPITRDVSGAQNLIDNFIAVYRCSSHEAADGRQIFEVPSLLALVTAAIGPAFGLSNDGVLAAATGAAVYTRGNSYYAPKEKARVIDTALDAVLCIKAASVGFEAFDTRSTLSGEVRDTMEAHLNAEIARVTSDLAQAGADKQRLEDELKKAKQDLADAEQVIRTRAGAETAAEIKTRNDAKDETLRLAPLVSGATREVLKLESQLAEYQGMLAQLGLAPGTVAGVGPKLSMSLANNATVQIDVARQYFEMVALSLYQVERVLAQRMSNMGTYDSEGIAAQFNELAQKRNALNQGGGNSLVKAAGGDPVAEQIELNVKTMRNELQTCVVRAKV